MLATLGNAPILIIRMLAMTVTPVRLAICALVDHANQEQPKIVVTETIVPLIAVIRGQARV